jgi:hypothetical protein
MTAKPRSIAVNSRRRSQPQKRRGKRASTGVAGGPQIGAQLVRTLRKLAKLGWVSRDGDRFTSPHTKIDYEFERACRIEDLPVPSEKPGDALWRWLRN